MPAPTKIYFPQIAVGWEDWVQIVNVSDEPANIMAIARNQQGQSVWSQEVKLSAFQPFTTAADTITVPVSMTVSSDMPIVGERHCHNKDTVVFNFPGAAPENMTVGNRIFFPEIYEGGLDWFQILNVSEQPTNINVIVRDKGGKVYKQFGVQDLGSYEYSANSGGEAFTLYRWTSRICNRSVGSSNRQTITSAIFSRNIRIME
jgi:hypothetical protein